MLSHIEDKSPALFRKLSGTNARVKDTKEITLVGCGSLGSKIGMHLSRNGNGPFMCIDNDMFMPHNSARHALTLTWTQNKAALLAISIRDTSKATATSYPSSAIQGNYSNSRLIIDSTASMAVRSFLMAETDMPPIVSGGLYGQGRYGILILENESKTCGLTDLWAHLYFRSLTDHDLRIVLFSSRLDTVQIGQGCSSQTMIVDDSRLSLFAATMSLKIQKMLEDGSPEKGEILISKYDDNYSLSSELVIVPNCTPVRAINPKDWAVSLSDDVYRQMEHLMSIKAPNETGGVLIGTVFLHAKKIVITGLIDAPADSIETPQLFVLGTEGLEKEIKTTEKKTNGKVTYLGTWHSHPRGGGASGTDKNTYQKLLFVRDYEPTICLIISPEEVVIL